MTTMDLYEWDEVKYQANLRKHGIAFELIYQFDWSKAASRLDERFEYGEVRTGFWSDRTAAATRLCSQSAVIASA